MLLFKKKFLNDIREGRKTQTIRVWKFRHMRAGQRSYIPGVGYIQIDEVEAVSLDDLSDEDAIPDGFTTVEELRAEICRIYSGQQLSERKVFRIRFHVLPAAEQTRLREERRQPRSAQSKG